MLLNICSKAIGSPGDSRFRRLRLANAALRKTRSPVDGSIDFQHLRLASNRSTRGGRSASKSTNNTNNNTGNTGSSRNLPCLHVFERLAREPLCYICDHTPILWVSWTGTDATSSPSSSSAELLPQEKKKAAGNKALVLRDEETEAALPALRAAALLLETHRDALASRQQQEKKRHKLDKLAELKLANHKSRESNRKRSHRVP